MNGIASNRLIRRKRITASNSAFSVESDHVPIAGCGASDRCAGWACRDSVREIAEWGGPGHVGSDEVSLDVSPRAADSDSVTASRSAALSSVSGNEIAGAGHVAANDSALRRLDPDAVAVVWNSRHAIRAGADAISLHDCVGRRDASDEDAIEGITRNDISRAGCCSANQRVQVGGVTGRSAN